MKKLKTFKLYLEKDYMSFMTQIEVTFLGTTAGIPTKKRNHPAIYLRYQSENEHCFLFDCGEGTQRQIFQTDLNFMRIRNIFITHWHADHFAGLLGLLETMSLEGREKPLTIYGPEAEKFVPILLELGYSTKNFKVLAKNVEFEGTRIQTVLEEDEYKITSIPVKHGIPAVAYAFVEKDRIKIDKIKARKLGLPERSRIYKIIKKRGFAIYKGKRINLDDIAKIERGKKVVYSGDTKPCANMIKLAKNADLLIHDSTYFEEINRKHATLDDVIEIAKKANVKKVILTHISRRYTNVKELNEKIADLPNFSIARDFQKIVLK